jgi:hypothetical protein
MIKISRYFTIPFDDPAISLDSLIAFSTDHLQRMIANNPGALSGSAGEGGSVFPAASAEPARGSGGGSATSAAGAASAASAVRII